MAYKGNDDVSVGWLICETSMKLISSFEGQLAEVYTWIDEVMAEAKSTMKV